jgi:hypothetical protein
VFLKVRIFVFSAPTQSQGILVGKRWKIGGKE